MNKPSRIKQLVIAVLLSPIVLAGCGQQQAAGTRTTASPQEAAQKIEQAPIPPEAKAAALQQANEEGKRRAAQGTR
jgi:outer membrane murein-binding lipoprotein Lpp